MGCGPAIPSGKAGSRGLESGRKGALSDLPARTAGQTQSRTVPNW
ncbi:hypothetical protein [Azospirillum endophyticum]